MSNLSGVACSDITPIYPMLREDQNGPDAVKMRDKTIPLKHFSNASEDGGRGGRGDQIL